MRNICSSFETEDMDTTIWKNDDFEWPFLEFRSFDS